MTDLSTTMSELESTMKSEVNDLGDSLQTGATEIKKEIIEEGDKIIEKTSEVKKEITDEGEKIMQKTSEIQTEVTEEGEKIVQKTTTIIRQTGSSIVTASQENPFTSEGELSKKADYILRHSTISRSEVRISDPDLHKGQESEISKTDTITAQTAPLNSTTPPQPSKENGKVGETVTPQGVQVEVGTANASQPQPQTAEQVKVKDKSKCKCCVVQ